MVDFSPSDVNSLDRPSLTFENALLNGNALPKLGSPKRQVSFGIPFGLVQEDPGISCKPVGTIRRIPDASSYTTEDG